MTSIQPVDDAPVTACKKTISLLTIPWEIRIAMLRLSRLPEIAGHPGMQNLHSSTIAIVWREH